MKGLDRELVREWYNGYSWGGPERVYNPCDILLLFDKRVFKAWWYETATPTFLFDILVERRIRSPTLDGMLVSERTLGTFDVGRIATEALLFQAGYLTVLRTENRLGRWYYRLGYPNREVRQSLNENLVESLTGGDPRQEEHSVRLFELLESADFDGLEQLTRSLFAGIPFE